MRIGAARILEFTNKTTFFAVNSRFVARRISYTHKMCKGLSGKTRLIQLGIRLIIKSERFAMSDQDIQLLESQFPSISGSAFAAARDRVLASGQSVLQSQDGVIYEVFPDGRRFEVKKIEPPAKVNAGDIYIIQ